MHSCEQGTHHNWSSYNEETKRSVSLQVEEKGKRKKSYHWASSWAWLWFTPPTLVKLGLYLQTPRHQQSPAEPWGRSQVKPTTGEQGKKRKMSSWAVKCHKSMPVFFFFCQSSRWFLKKSCSKYVAIRCSQYCRGTLTVLLLPDDIKTLITHFDQSDPEMTPDHIWWRVFHGM